MACLAEGRVAVAAVPTLGLSLETAVATLLNVDVTDTSVFVFSETGEESEANASILGAIILGTIGVSLLGFFTGNSAGG